MFFNSKALSILIAFLVSILIGVILFTMEIRESIALIVIIIFVLSAILTWVLLEWVVFKELRKLEGLISNIKKKEYRRIVLQSEIQSDALSQIRKEIADFADQKQKEIEELHKLATFRREFLADVSHELKTPIFAAQGFLHTLIDGALDDLEVRDKFLSKAADSMDSLNMLVQDLITISQLESGELKMVYQNFDLVKLTTDIFSQVEHLALAKKIKTSINKFSPKSAYVYGDKMRLGQVMTNLIVNAIKYGNQGGLLEVSFKIDQDKVEVVVQDNGPGIEEKHLNRIFERFYRIDKSRSKDGGGTGLGLSIVKHILEAHHAIIHVESTVKVGSKFYFILQKGKVINENG